MNNKISLILTLIFCALLAQAQDAPAPDTTWESDPLDVLESGKKTEVVEPSVPKFTEIPAAGSEQAPKSPTSSATEQQPPPSKIEETDEVTLDDEQAPQKVPPPETESTPSKALSFPQEVPPPMIEKPKREVRRKVPVPREDTATPPVMGSDPDYSKEARFHRIYKTYNEQPTPEEVWDKIVGAREAKVYKVQKGDTLFDISKTFFDDPFYWPKVWSLNSKQILNPHEIMPGLDVQFFPGSMEDAPSLELGKEGDSGDKDEAVVEADEKVAPQKQAGVKIPKPRRYTPLLKNIPGSLPAYRAGIDRKASMELQVDMPKVQMAPALEYLTYYVSDEPIQGVGVVTATELNLKTAGDYQYIYVRLDSGGEGKGFVAQKNSGPVYDPDHFKKGHMVEVEGEVEVLERVNEQKNIYRAIVKKTIQPLEVGAILTPGKMSMFSPSVGEFSSGGGAKIMGGQFDRNRKLFGSDSLVFLDGGSSQGLQEGQVLPVYADQRVRNKKNDAIANDRMIGVVKIVRVTQGFATAYVAKAVDDILLGDYVGKQQAQAFGSDAVEQQTSAPSTPSNSNFEEDIKEVPELIDDTAPSSGTGDNELEL